MSLWFTQAAGPESFQCGDQDLLGKIKEKHTENAE